MALGQDAPSSVGYVDLFAQFQTFLIAEYAAGRRVILIFDEAQNLSRESLEELRMFTNINSGKDDLLQLVLVVYKLVQAAALVQRRHEAHHKGAAVHHLQD
jgi:type II secretory pathway predicted ATPase ExeA